MIPGVLQISSTTRNLVPRFKVWSKGERLGKDGAQHKIGTWGLSRWTWHRGISRVEIQEVIESKVRRCNKKLQADGQSFDVWNRVWKGVQSIKNKYCIWYQNRSLEGGSWITYEAKREEQFWKTGMYMRVRFWSCGTVGYGPTMWLKVGRALTSCPVMIARHVIG